MNTQSSPPTGHRTRRLTALAMVLVGLFAPATPATAEPGSWTRKANMPMAVSTPAACTVDGILYVIGGHDRSYQQLSTVFAYDPKTDQWTRKADLPTARRWLSVAAVDGIIYAMGGGGWQNPVSHAVESYDPKTDQWTRRTPMPTARFTFAACAVDGLIYAIGGGDDAMMGIASVEVFDPRTDRWTSKRPMPQAIGLLAADVAGGLIHVCHGKDVLTYDPSLDQWSIRSPFPTWSHGAMASSVGGILYFFGGCSVDYQSSYALVTGFNPVSGTVVAQRRMPRTRAFGTSAVIDGKVYVIGGADKEPVIHPEAIFWNVLDVFDPQGGVTPQVVAIDRKGADQLTLTWLGESGILYGLETSTRLTGGSWTRVTFSTGKNTIQATNALVGATVEFSATNTSRFYRVIDVDY